MIANLTGYRHHKDWREPHLADFEPDSPELNPIERVWKLTRRRCLHNRYFPALQEIIDAVEAVFAGWADRNEALQIIRNYLRRYAIDERALHTTSAVPKLAR